MEKQVYRQIDFTSVLWFGPSALSTTSVVGFTTTTGRWKLPRWREKTRWEMQAKAGIVGQRCNSLPRVNRVWKSSDLEGNQRPMRFSMSLP
jgi:hypothetical protein